MYKLLFGASAVACIAIAPALATSPQGGHRQMMNQTEARTDVQGHVVKMFARLDGNKDGFISTAEMDAMQAQHAQRVEAKMDQRAEHFDAAKMFAHLDTNKDGKLTKAEVDAVRAARKGASQGGHGSERLFARADTNKDGAITLAELKAAPKPDHAAMDRRLGAKGHMLGQADLNKDGKVSLAEAQQSALQHFDRADANHDGKLTPEERKAAVQAMRAQHKG